MAVTSYRASATCINDTGTGTLGWFKDDSSGVLAGTEVNADDNIYAGIFGSPSTTTNYLKCTNFGFTSSDIPSGSSIDGFEVEVIQFRNGNPTVSSTRLFPVKTGTISGTNFGTSGDWALSETAVVYGSSTQLGGLSWTQSDVTASNFGVAISMIMGTGLGSINRTALIDQVRIRIYYTPGGAAFDQKKASCFLPWFI